MKSKDVAQDDYGRSGEVADPVPYLIGVAGSMSWWDMVPVGLSHGVSGECLYGDVAGDGGYCRQVHQPVEVEVLVAE